MGGPPTEGELPVDDGGAEIEGMTVLMSRQGGAAGDSTAEWRWAVLGNVSLLPPLPSSRFLVVHLLPFTSYSFKARLWNVVGAQFFFFTAAAAAAAAGAV